MSGFIGLRRRVWSFRVSDRALDSHGLLTSTLHKNPWFAETLQTLSLQDLLEAFAFRV